MTLKNKLLQRQLKKISGDQNKPPTLEEWQKFLSLVDSAYTNGDEGRYLLERALSISSQEMKETIEKQKKISAQLAHTSKLTSLGTLASGVAHELNNPLAGIMGYAELLETSENLNNEEKAKIARIISLCDRSANIVKQLLKFSRKSSEDPTQSISLITAIKESIEIGTAQFKYDNVSVNLDTSEMETNIIGDSNRVISIFQNLISNSFYEFQRKDQSQIEDATINIFVDKEKSSKSHVAIIFKDNAGGIPHNIINEIFDPFFTTKEVGSGTGLGLTLVSNMVEELGGEISVKSEGKETIFTILLKVDPKFVKSDKFLNTNESNIINFGQSSSTKLQRVLIVDDEIDLLEILSAKLKGKFDISATSSPVNAIDLLSSQNYDLLITDLRMPNLSGQDIITFAKQHNPNLAICLVSGHAQAAGELLSDKSLSDVVFIEKPIPKMDVLQLLITEAFEKVEPSAKIKTA